MKRILVPVDFSSASAHALQYAYQTALDRGLTLSLLHCYSPFEYNRKFDFKGGDYGIGIQKKLIAFYRQHTEAKLKENKFLAMAGNLGEKVISISADFELIMISGHELNSATSKWLGSRSLTIVSGAKCPVVIVPITASYLPWDNIWHIKRRDNEPLIIAPCLKKLKINPTNVAVKTFQQTTYKSSIWESIVKLTKKPSAQSERNILEKLKDEKVDLMLLVSHHQETFQKFVNSNESNVIFHFEIPVMVCQAGGGAQSKWESK